MSDTSNLRFPESPGDKKPVSIQLAPSRGGTTFIQIYRYGEVYCAYADEGAYQVPLAMDDRLDLLPQAAAWLRGEAAAVAYRVHTAFSIPTLADATRHFLLDGLVVEETLKFDKAWNILCESLDEAGPDVDPTVKATAWHQAFCESWWAIKAGLEAHS